jgi:lipopolysaccharide heptosyltransferase II
VEKSPKPINRSRDPIDWNSVKRVLVIRLRSIGDTVLATPSLNALKRFLPHAEIDILLEDWVAPLLEGHPDVENIVTIGKTLSEKVSIARALRRRNYDVVFNLHGGSTSTFLTYATGAKHRVGYAGYRYSFLYSDVLSSSADFWQRSPTHSAEQQLALLGFVGVPVDDRPRSSLPVRTACVSGRPVPAQFALFHPTAAFDTKIWPTENFARIAETLRQRGIETVAVAAKNERSILEKLKSEAKVPITTYNDLTLPEITALASKAKLFVGNDSGIAHIAAAVNTPTVVFFGSSNRDHWRPWTDAPNEVVFSEKECPHFKGEIRAGTEHPTCIRCVSVEQVTAAIDRLLQKGEPEDPPLPR